MVLLSIDGCSHASALIGHCEAPITEASLAMGPPRVQRPTSQFSTSDEEGESKKKPMAIRRPPPMLPNNLIDIETLRRALKKGFVRADMEWATPQTRQGGLTSQPVNSDRFVIMYPVPRYRLEDSYLERLLMIDIYAGLATLPCLKPGPLLTQKCSNGYRV